MRQQLQIEIDKIKQDPQYIDYFIKLIGQKWGESEGNIEATIDEMILYFKTAKEGKIYGKLVLLKERNDIAQGKFQECIQLAETAYDFFKETEDIEGMIASCNALLVSHMKIGNFTEAINYAIKGITLGEKEEQTDFMVLLLNTAQLYIMIKEYKKAKQILHNILEMEKWLTEEKLIMIESALLKIHLKENKLETASVHCKRAYEMANKFEEEIGYMVSMNEILCLKAELQGKKSLDIQAEKEFKSAYEYATVNQFRENKIKVLIAWGDHLLGRGQTSLAKEKIKEAIQEGEEIASKYLFVQAFKCLSEIYEKEEKWKEAFDNLKKAQGYENMMYSGKMKLGLEKLSHKNMEKEIDRYKMLYEQMQLVAQIGACFTANLKGEHIQEMIRQEVIKLLDMDMMGIAFLEQEDIDYKLCDVQGKWIETKNDLARYTARLAEYCIEYQSDMVIDDGNFEEYSLKTIKDSETEMKLQSVIAVLLKAGNKVLGAMIIGSYKFNAYTKHDLNSARIIASYLAITLQNMNLYHQLVYLADHDDLTGVLTRRAVLKIGEKIFKKNQKTSKKTAVIMFDTDYFKKVNDKYGHQLGDQVLKEIGNIMKQCIREKDCVGRYGGEEFIMILDDVSEKDVITIAENIKTKLERTVFETKRDKQITVTLSGGIYICNEYTINLDDAIRFADHALYRAKISGRNRIMSY